MHKGGLKKSSKPTIIIITVGKEIKLKFISSIFLLKNISPRLSITKVVLKLVNQNVATNMCVYQE